MIPEMTDFEKRFISHVDESPDPPIRTLYNEFDRFEITCCTAGSIAYKYYVW